MTPPALTPGAAPGKPPAAGVARAWWRRVGIAVAGACIIVACFALALRGYGPFYLNLSPGTDSGGPVSIATNHTDYRTTERVQVTVTNHRSGPIYTLEDGDPCSVLFLQEQIRPAQWGRTSTYAYYDGCGNPADPGYCVGGPGQAPSVTIPSTIIEIAPGASRQETLYPPVSSTFFPDPLPPGLYRLAFAYSTEPINAYTKLTVDTSTLLVAPYAVTYSATLRIHSDPDQKPQQRPLCA